MSEQFQNMLRFPVWRAATPSAAGLSPKRCHSASVYGSDNGLPHSHIVGALHGGLEQHRMTRHQRWPSAGR